MRHYHGRWGPDGPLVWVHDTGKIRRLDRDGAEPEQLARAILADAVGRHAARRLGLDFAAALLSWGESWDATEHEIQDWASGRGA